MKSFYITPKAEVIGYEIETPLLSNSPGTFSIKEKEYEGEGWSNKKENAHHIWK